MVVLRGETGEGVLLGMTRVCVEAASSGDRASGAPLLEPLPPQPTQRREKNRDTELKNREGKKNQTFGLLL